jgi:hypothetical protein
VLFFHFLCFVRTRFLSQLGFTVHSFLDVLCKLFFIRFLNYVNVIPRFILNCLSCLLVLQGQLLGFQLQIFNFLFFLRETQGIFNPGVFKLTVLEQFQFRNLALEFFQLFRLQSLQLTIPFNIVVLLFFELSALDVHLFKMQLPYVLDDFFLLCSVFPVLLVHLTFLLFKVRTLFFFYSNQFFDLLPLFIQ